MAFHVKIDGGYGVDDGAIYLYDGDQELVMWDSAEWRQEPSLVYVIANAIRIGYEEGPQVIRSRLARGKDTGEGHIPLCPECGEPARGTLERVEGVCDFFEQDGQLWWGGETDILWDTIETVTDEHGHKTVVCSNGHDWSVPDLKVVG